MPTELTTKKVLILDMATKILYSSNGIRYANLYDCEMDNIIKWARNAIKIAKFMVKAVEEE